MDISTEVDAAIRAHLPSAVGDVLKRRLVQAEEDARTVKSLKAALETSTNEEKRLQARVATLESHLSQHKALDARTIELAEKERKMENELLKVQLASAERFATLVSDTLKGLVRNTEFRSAVYDNHNRAAVIPSAGGSAYTQQVTETTSRTVGSTAD